MNNKGFTLIELIATIAILALIVLISVPAVTSVINGSKNKSYNILVSNIIVAAKDYYEECKYNNEAISSICSQNSVTLKQLVDYGFLNGTNKEGCAGANCKTVINPKNDNDIGACKIKVTATEDAKGKITYTINKNDTNSSCPTDTEYKNG